jgi:hypothetical protein
MWIPILIISLLLVAGCESKQTTYAPDHDALVRVSRILDQEVPTLKIPPRTPAHFDLPTLSEARIGLTQALKLGECGLVPLIAERNSALGRQKQASTRFWYEWSIDAGLAQCADQFSDTDWFQDATRAKAKDLEIALAQVLLSGEEARQLRTSTSTAYPSLAVSGSTYTEAMQNVRAIALNALTRDGAPADGTLSDFEDALKRWGQTHHHATLGQSVRESIGWLKHANELQSQAIRRNRICPMGTPTEAGRRIDAFVRGHFTHAIQPRLSETARAVSQMKALWEPLLIHNPTLQDTLDFDRLLSLESGTLDTFKSVVDQHIDQWQALLDQCDLSPRA